jgi:transcriptional regulator with XRE-family HTH domain
MLGTELPDWRKRNGFTQETLGMALGIKSRQTIITWEKSAEPLSRLVQLALFTLENHPEERHVTALRTVLPHPIPG